MTDQESKKNPERTQSQLVKEISQALKKRREARKASLNDISSALKIRVPVLKAIEAGEWDQVPGGVYLKGFLTKYATYLGLDPAEIVDPYFQAPTAPPEEEMSEEPTTDQIDSRVRVLWISIGAVVVVLMALIRFVSFDDGAPGLSAGDDILSTQPVESTVPAAIESDTPGDPHQIEIYSPYPLWLRVDAEDQSFEGFIPQASTWSWEGMGQFTIRLGHTRDVSLVFDGQLVKIDENQRRVLLPDES